MKLPKAVREAILAKDKNHVFGRDGFCLNCHNMHRTDFRPNDLCPKMFNPSPSTPTTATK